jgi:hypothetical protein
MNVLLELERIVNLYQKLNSNKHKILNEISCNKP